MLYDWWEIQYDPLCFWLAETFWTSPDWLSGISWNLVQMNICGKVMIKWKSNMATTRTWDIFFLFIQFCSYFLWRDLRPMGLLFNKCITTHSKDHSYEVSLQSDQNNIFPIVNLQIFRPLKTCRKELQCKISNLYAHLPQDYRIYGFWEPLRITSCGTERKNNNNDNKLSKTNKSPNFGGRIKICFYLEVK